MFTSCKKEKCLIRCFKFQLWCAIRKAVSRIRTVFLRPYANPVYRQIGKLLEVFMYRDFKWWIDPNAISGSGFEFTNSSKWVARVNTHLNMKNAFGSIHHLNAMLSSPCHWSKFQEWCITKIITGATLFCISSRHCPRCGSGHVAHRVEILDTALAHCPYVCVMSTWLPCRAVLRVMPKTMTHTQMARTKFQLTEDISKKHNSSFEFGQYACL